MDCESVRRRLLTDPRDPDPALLAHTRVCRACAREARETRAFERRLLRALADETAAAPDRAPGNARLHRPLVLLALLVLPLLAAGGWWLAIQSGRDSDAGDVLAAGLGHVREEIAMIDGTRAGLSSARARPATVDLLLRGLDLQGRIRLDGDWDRLRYAGRCRVGDRDSLHLILEGRRGPVTALLLPGRRLAGPREAVSRRFDVLLVPAGDAALALFGEHGEPLQDLARRLMPPKEGR